MLSLLLTLLVIGIVAGFLARAIVPGNDPMSFWETVALGIVGSFVGGFLSSLLFEGDLALRGAGIVGSIVGAIVALLIYRQVRRPHHAA